MTDQIADARPPTRAEYEWSDAVAALAGSPGAPSPDAIEALVKAGDALWARVQHLTEALGQMCMAVMQGNHDAAFEIARDTPLEFTDGIPRAALAPPASTVGRNG
jgi:hypothetical protein